MIVVQCWLYPPMLLATSQGCPQVVDNIGIDSTEPWVIFALLKPGIEISTKSFWMDSGLNS